MDERERGGIMTCLESISFEDLSEKRRALCELFENCRLCPRRCGVKRKVGQRGFCGMTAQLVISAASPHFGEEPELVGTGGSGTIFFSGCSLGCVFCQNRAISLERAGEEVNEEWLADTMLDLQRKKVHNINLVTPTHFIPQILYSLMLAKQQGLRIPLVYNCGGYESLEVIRILEGVFDIYMPDIKFFDSAKAERYCRAVDYPAVVRPIVQEMFRQVGDLEFDDEGRARRGLIVRHLVMPDSIEESKAIIDFVAGELSRETYFNLMDQYRPDSKVFAYPEISRFITEEEFKEVVFYARNKGLYRGLIK